MSFHSSILTAMLLVPAGGDSGSSEHDAPQATAVSYEVCPSDPHEPMLIAKGLRASGHFAEAIVCGIRAYGACMDQERDVHDDRDDCQHIGELTTRDLGLRAGDILDDLYLHDIEGSEDDEAAFAASLADANFFVATVSLELGKTSAAKVPPRMPEDLSILEQRITKLTKGRELRLARAGRDAAKKQPSAVEPPRVGPAPSTVAGEREATREPGPVDPQPSRRRGSGLIGFGVGAMAVGTGATIAGTAWWRFSNQELEAAHDRFAIHMATANSSHGEAGIDAMATLQRVEHEHHRSVGASIALVAFGASSLAAGVALTAWGAMRSNGHVRRLSLTPGIARDGAALVLRGRF